MPNNSFLRGRLVAMLLQIAECAGRTTKKNTFLNFEHHDLMMSNMTTLRDSVTFTGH